MALDAPSPKLELSYFVHDTVDVPETIVAHPLIVVVSTTDIPYPRFTPEIVPNGSVAFNWPDAEPPVVPVARYLIETFFPRTMYFASFVVTVPNVIEPDPLYAG